MSIDAKTKAKVLEHLALLYAKYPTSFERVLKLDSENPEAFEGMIRIWNAVAGVRFLGGGLIRILVLAAAMIGAWVTVKSYVFEMFAKVLHK